MGGYPLSRCRWPRLPLVNVPESPTSPATATHAAGEPAVSPRDDVLISARNLTKTFGDFTAVDGIDVEVHRGEAFGFLGPNGAGKSSTMRMIGCVSPVSGGDLRIFGQDPSADGPRIRARLGVVPQQDNLDEELTVRENLIVYGRYFGISRAECRRRATELLEFAQLVEKADAKVDTLSGGMKRRLTIARSLINGRSPRAGRLPRCRGDLAEGAQLPPRSGSAAFYGKRHIRPTARYCAGDVAGERRPGEPREAQQSNGSGGSTRQGSLE